MKIITLISTLHEENGKCNAEELSVILNDLRPDVVFLEALDKTYTEYEKHLFYSYEVYHKKLEIKAIQIYSQKASFEYIPVLEFGLSDSFEKKFEILSNNNDFQGLVNRYKSLASDLGFQFLNSKESIRLQEEMRTFESLFLEGNKVEKEFNESIDKYENAMLDKIISCCKNKDFNTAVFMCGAAHRKSIIEKFEKILSDKQLNIQWAIYGF